MTKTAAHTIRTLVDLALAGVRPVAGHAWASTDLTTFGDVVELHADGLHYVKPSRPIGDDRFAELAAAMRG